MQVGACIVTPDNRIASVGCNNWLSEVMQSESPPEDDEDFNEVYGCPYGMYEMKAIWLQPLMIIYTVSHAEYQAIINKEAVDPRGCTIYITQFPCHSCARLLVQSGIVKVVYRHFKELKKITYKFSRDILTKAGVEIIGILYDCKKEQYITEQS